MDTTTPDVLSVANNSQERLRITSSGKMIFGSFHYPNVPLQVTQCITEKPEIPEPTPREITDTMVDLYLKS
jgi:hypothetical protein